MIQPAARTLPGRLPGLEALRGFAAICILLLHTNANFGHMPQFGRGYLAVEFFLMLSGFLMAYVQEPRLAGGVSILPFMAKRYWRLWPMMALGGLIGIPRLFIATPDAGQFALMVVANLALLPVWFGMFAFALNIPAWTIFFELVANALHVVIFRHMRGWMMGLAIVALALLMVRIGMAARGFDVGAKVENFLLGWPRTVFAYLIGVVLGRRWREKAPAFALPPLLAIPAMPVILVAGWKLGLNAWWFDFGFTVIACPLMIAGALGLRGNDGIAGQIGKLSFPLFAVQMPILEGSRMLGFNGWQGGSAAFAGGILAAVLASALGRWRSARLQEKAA